VIAIGETEQKETDTRRQARFNLFSIVKFKNDPCIASTKNGTCYTAAECEQRNGVNAGSCAQGYGVCCTFSATCGQSYSENCTYFDSSSPTAGACSASVCKCQNNICQMRLDFDSFTISGPSTSTDSAGTLLNGQLQNDNDGKTVSTRSQCLTDTFSVSSPGVSSPPTICGVNSGEHMYIDVCEDCVDLNFQLGQAGVGTALANRQWSIKVTQYDCCFSNLAPSGCTQYFYGSNTAAVKTFNFDGGQHLANQNHQICVRNERGMCRICWVQVARGDFDVSYKKDTAPSMSSGKVSPTKCCGYGKEGTKTTGYDCVVIPGAKKESMSLESVPSEICGNLFVTMDGKTFPTMSICSMRCPFSIHFASDNYEFSEEDDGEGKRDNAGFMLTYIQDAMGC